MGNWATLAWALMCHLPAVNEESVVAYLFGPCPGAW